MFRQDIVLIRSRPYGSYHYGSVWMRRLLLPQTGTTLSLLGGSEDPLLHHEPYPTTHSEIIFYRESIKLALTLPKVLTSFIVSTICVNYIVSHPVFYTSLVDLWITPSLSYYITKWRKSQEKILPSRIFPFFPSLHRKV